MKFLVTALVKGKIKKEIITSKSKRDAINLAITKLMLKYNCEYEDIEEIDASLITRL